jgi:anthranilate phosphoribosyltransferase
MSTKASLEKLLGGNDLSENEAGDLLRALAADEVGAAAAGALLAALRAKGESASEVRGFANAMRELAVSVDLPAGIDAVDVVGTGGDASGSLNLSTGSGLLAAACGVPVVKHGNRSISSKCGSADVLESLGIALPSEPGAAIESLQGAGFAFLFAPAFHPAMKAIAPVRAALGIRTIFNILGPLTNPATPPYHVIGAFSVDMAELMAESLSGMDIARAFVVHGEPGWDEATPVGPFELFDVSNGNVRHERRDPADFGLSRCSPQDLAGGDAAYNAAALARTLAGEDTGAHADALALGAGLALEVSGFSETLAGGIEAARAAMASGAGANLLAALTNAGD